MRRLFRLVIAACCAAATACSGGRGTETREVRAAAGAEATTIPARQVGDLRAAGTVPAGSAPHAFVVTSSPTRAWFAADDGATGDELWVTDGTGGGTSLVKDLRPGRASALPGGGGRLEAVAFAGGLLFAANDGARGAELWFTDGTPEGTRLVKDVAPGSASSSPRAFAPLDGKAYFAATVALAVELWETDGTPAGTRRVADLGLGDADPVRLVPLGGKLFFGARGTRPGLWSYPPGGAAAEVAPFWTVPGELTPFAGKLWFAAALADGADVQLWESDGSAAQTRAAPAGAGLKDPALLTLGDTRLFFAATTTADGKRDVFATDGAAAFTYTNDDVRPAALAAIGTRVVFAGLPDAQGRTGLYGAASLDPVPLASATWNPRALTAGAGGVLFVVTETTSPAALWRTDGLEAGTGRVFPSGGPEGGEIASLGSFAVLSGADGANGAELWRSDGTLEGTSLVENLRPDLPSSLPADLTVSGDRLFFSAEGDAAGRELWTTSDGLGATLLNIAFDAGGAAAAQSSDPRDLVAAGPGILFAATDASVGRELWTSDGTGDGTASVVDLDPAVVNGIPQGALRSPAWLTRLGDRVLFAADDATGLGRELWAHDLAAGTTSLVADLHAGAPSSLPELLTAAGGAVWLAAADGDATYLSKIYRTDGTPVADATDLAAPDVNCSGEVVHSARWFGDLGGSAVFAAERDFFPGEVKLFRYEPACECGRPCVRPVVDDPFDGYDPESFATVGPTGWFAARDLDGNAWLWRTDGLPGGTAPVLRIGTSGGGAIASIVELAGKLYFVANDERTGHEVWSLDPSTGAAGVVKDVLPLDVGGAEGSALVPVPLRGRLLFAADDGASGRELWISDGTAAGTRLLQDLRPGAESSNPSDFTKVGDLVYFTADDGSSGRELWVLDTTPAGLDLTPPVPFCPATPLRAEATTRTGADPVYAITASDAGPGVLALSYSPPPGSTTVSLEDTLRVRATATDGTGNQTSCDFFVTVVDTLPPALTCPADLAVEAASAEGALVSFEATAVDTVTAVPVVTSSHASGSLFPLGPDYAALTTPVTVDATDGHGNRSSCTFAVTVADTTPPAVECPSLAPVEATTTAGVEGVTWAAAAAVDLVSPLVTVVYAPAPGDPFPLGTTSVTATAVDWVGNRSSCSFPVRVVDREPALLSCPADPVLEATSPAGASWTFAATVTDPVSPDLSLVYSGIDGVHASGAPVTAPYALGQEFVVVTASGGAPDCDPAVRGSPCQPTCTVIVKVQDTTPAVLTCPAAPVPWEATSAAGALVPFAADVASATDAATLDPTVVYSPAQGSLFALAADKRPTATTVTASSTDVGGNTSSCTFDVLVYDATPPSTTVRCGFDDHRIVLEAAGPDGTHLALPRSFEDTVSEAAALDVYFVDTLAGEPVPAEGLQPLGTRLIEARATDEAGNGPTVCAFAVTVQDTTAPVASCPASFAVEATGPGGASATWADATGTDAVTDPAVLVASYTRDAVAVAQGSLFALGTTTVTATLRDEAQNGGTCSFTVRVEDTTDPAITCPALAPVEATANGFAFPVFAATATDAVTLAPLVTYDLEPGDPFPVGTTTVVTATATDAALNAASCQLAVTVVDTTPPSITCPDDRSIPANGAVPVQLPAPIATDAGTPQPRVTATHQSGDVFPVGTTTVRYTATDDAGHSTSCTMSVTVQPTPFGSGGGCASASGGALALLGVLAAALRRRRAAR